VSLKRWPRFGVGIYNLRMNISQKSTRVPKQTRTGVHSTRIKQPARNVTGT